ncbi:hypothetical protein TSTA_036500 [Talaromyces stipitatus ATCC 10500]|uniref:Uncharacterized protein n=1 Tax=Talaromyces stipitatus (strain ATCC 10500 / CBS 375.48 / QM 6759 / NRRL 1006) TaxID=441959 RepID=B8M8B2_TALSN|nr:uncharacterized protein TSTA_036500 [Talaromyces stipitatus ATCC 10500]EED20425.1 hypothetical protein TSTA_036500 [Talaromyces stipitatus ATCC 10500]
MWHSILGCAARGLLWLSPNPKHCFPQQTQQITTVASGTQRAITTSSPAASSSPNPYEETAPGNRQISQVRILVMRYKDSPPPTDWNFGGSGATSTATATSTIKTTSTVTPIVTATSTSLIASASASSTGVVSSSSSSTESEPGLSSGQKADIGVGASSHTSAQTNTSPVTSATEQQQEPTATKKDMKTTILRESRYLSGTESSVSELPSQNYDENSSYRDSTVQRVISELMGTPRAEMG